jgi:hypothetical protein
MTLTATASRRLLFAAEQGNLCFFRGVESAMIARVTLAIIMMSASVLLLWKVFYGGPQPDVESAAAVPAKPYALRDWSEGTSRSLNISVYIFRDVNRSGDHDVGDLPMASVVVEMIAPDGSRSRELSNINGYANFKMSHGNTRYPINEAGEGYVFRVETPPGWQVSTDTGEQTIAFRRVEGSVAGVVAEPAPNWVGLMPELELSAQFLPPEGGELPGDLTLELIDEDGAIEAAAPDADGSLQRALIPGLWTLRAASESLGWRWQRPVVMGQAPVSLVPVRVGEPVIEALPYPMLENFDWLRRSVIEKIPNGHRGLNWNYLLAVDNQQYKGPGYVNGMISPHAVAYNSSGHPVTISAPAGQRFDFVGGYFSVAWEKAHGEELLLTAYRDGQEVASHALTLSYLGAAYLDADLRGIDRLELTTRHYWQMVADDLSFRLAQPIAE